MNKLGIKAVAWIGAGICGLVGAGVYTLSESGEVSLRGFVALAGAGAGAALLAWVSTKFGGPKPPAAPGGAA